MNKNVFKLNKNIIANELINTYKNPEIAKKNPLIMDLLLDYSDIIYRLNNSLYSLLNNNIKIDYLNPNDFKKPFASTYIINELFHIHLFKKVNTKKGPNFGERFGANFLRINLIFDFHKHSFYTNYFKDNKNFNFFISKINIYDENELNIFEFEQKNKKKLIINLINLNSESFFKTLKYNFYDVFLGKTNDKIENDQFNKHVVQYIENNLRDIYKTNQQNINKKFEMIKLVGEIYKPILENKIYEQNILNIAPLIQRNEYIHVSQFINYLEEINPLLNITYDVDLSEQFKKIRIILKNDIKNTIKNC